MADSLIQPTVDVPRINAVAAPRRFRPTLLDAAVLVAVFAAAVAHLNSPFAGDQFLFLQGAKKLAHHGVMYRDFWDLKQPLIFYVYCVAGKIFGFTERGVHAFEACYQTLFAALLIVLCAPSFRARWVASCVPLLTVGAYELYASNYALTSVEALAGFPIFAAGALAAAGLRNGKRAGFAALAAGFAGALAAGFKAVFFPLVVVVWLAAFVAARTAGGPPRLRSALLIGLGWAVPVGLGLAYFAHAGVLDVALRTAFVDPPRIVRGLAAADRSPFWPEARAFGRMLWPLLVLAIAGAAVLRRSFDVLVLQMCAWFAAGCVLIALQVWSYDYRFYLIVVPIGVLAARGVDELWPFARMLPRWGQAVVAAAACVLLAASTQSALRMHARWSGWAHDNERAAASSLTLLDAPEARPGPVFIFGDARLYYVSHRDQAGAINGWSPQLLLPEQWHALHAQLATVAPPYVMIETDDVVRLERSPEMLAYIASRYRPVYTARDGIWYERR
jgi:hypothetical protein